MNSYKTKLKQKYPDCWRWISLAQRVPGELNEDEANLLFHLALARTPAVDPVIVEVGAERGKNSMLLASGICGKIRPRLVCVSRGGEQQPLLRTLRRCGLGHVVEIAAGDAKASWKRTIDILFVNATELAEIAHWSRWVRRGGIVIVRGATPAVAESLQSADFIDFRQVHHLTLAVKQCACSLTPVDEATEAGHVRALLDRSIEAMLHLNTVPSLKKAVDGYLEDEHLEDATDIAMARLQDYVRRAAREIAEDRHAIQELHRSWSWRLTAPLRLGIETLHAVAGLLTSFGSGSPKARIAALVQWMVFGRQLRASGLLDESFYRDSYPGVAWAGTSPLLHFFVSGAFEGSKPNELFDIDYYLALNPDVARSGINPLAHYLRSGAYEGRDPHPYFSSSFYLDQNPDVREGGLNPLAHYLAPGIAEGRDPNPWFDTSEYLEQNPDVATFALNPLVHHIETTHPAAARSTLRTCSP